MKPFQNPEQFTFTNRFGGPHLNKSFLQRRIMPLLGFKNGKLYGVITPIPNRMKRDSTIHIVSPFYTGDF
jgi:hypothetical protein